MASAMSWMSLLGSVSWLKGTAAQNGNIHSVRLSKATGWDQDEVLSPLLQAGQVSSPMGDSFHLSL